MCDKWKWFYDQLLKSNIFGKVGSKNKVFHVLIGISDNIKINSLRPQSQETIYVQNEENICDIIDLVYDLCDGNKIVAEHAILSWLSSYLSCEIVAYLNSIRFSTPILTDYVSNKG